jgi:hypothetical protein
MADASLHHRSFVRRVLDLYLSRSQEALNLAETKDTHALIEMLKKQRAAFANLKHYLAAGAMELTQADVDRAQDLEQRLEAAIAGHQERLQQKLVSIDNERRMLRRYHSGSTKPSFGRAV